jgi:hypothetical protein
VAESVNMGQWETFAAPEIFNNLQDIREFYLSVSGRFDLIWLVEKLAVEVGQRVYDSVAEVLLESGLHREEQLSFQVGQSVITVSYEDDRFGFQVDLTRSGFHLRRRGSSLNNFHRWYLAVARHFGLLVEKVFYAVSQVVERHTGFDFTYRPTRAEYRFEFILFDFTEAGGDVLQNVEVLKDVVPLVPGSDGGLQSTVQNREGISRVDVKVIRDQEKEGRVWSEVYDLQAPANRDRTSIWVYFSFLGATRDDAPGDGRIDFDSAAFIGDWVTPLVDFLRDRGIVGFLGSVVGDKKFRTTSAQLP